MNRIVSVLGDGSRSEPRKHQWEEHQTMERSQENEGDVHAEIVQSENC